MSDDDSADDLGELQELMALYAKAEDKDQQKKAPYSKATEPAYVETPMEKVIFGDKATFLSNLAKSVGHKRTKKDTESEATNDNDEDDEDRDENAKKPKPAWVDSDDDDLDVGDTKRRTRHTGPLNHLRKDKSYKEYLTARFQRTVNQPKWAALDQDKEENSSDDTDDEEPLLKTVGLIDHKAKTKELRPKNLHFKRVRDLNRATYGEGVVSSIQFHPTSTAALVSGESCLATIYSVDGQKNEKLHSIRFRDFPISCSRIMPCGTKAFFSSMRHYYYAYDLLEAKETKLFLPAKMNILRSFDVSPCGKYIACEAKFGAINLLTANTNELLYSFKQEGQLRGMCFTADSQRLICSGASCNVNVLSLRTNRIEHTFIDDGCINGRSLQLAPNQRLLATGSCEGVVNVYDYESIYKSATPQPEKRFMNLRTSITDLQFNNTSELLAMSSSLIPNGMKLAHFPSATIYSNFPGQHDSVGYVNTMAFSPNSGYLAFGSKGKKAPLFRIKYFKNY